MRRCWKCEDIFEYLPPVKIPRKGYSLKCPRCGVVEVWGEGWMITRPHPDHVFNEVVGKELSRLIPKAEKRWGWVREQIVVCWDRGLRTFYGKAYPRMGCIRLGIKTIPRHEDVVPVIRHEFAHIVTRGVFGYEVPPHGREWRRIAKSLGCREGHISR